MRAFATSRTAQTNDEIWLLEHEPVFTLGQAGKREHILADTGIAVIQTERGGQVTYHGPGQVVAYTLIDIRRREIKVREFVALLEDAVIDTLASYNVTGSKKVGAPGIYVTYDGDLQKIAALGLKVTQGGTFHGVSLNVAMDLAPYAAINACGYPGLRTTDMKTLGVSAEPAEVATVLANALMARLALKEK